MEGAIGGFKFMSSALSIALASLIAAIFMAAFLFMINRWGWIQSNMLWTIGNLVSKTPQRAKTIGLSLHVVAGIFFGFLYVLLWSALNIEGLSEFVFLGVLTGLLHGVAVSISLILLLMNRTQGFKVAISHIAAHGVYGFVLGCLIGLFQQNYGTVSRFAKLFGDTIRPMLG